MADVATPPGSSRRRRLIARVVVLLLALGLAWPSRGESWFGTAVLLPALSPLVALGGAAAARSAGLLTLLALPAVLLAWWIPRVLCSYVCPVGLLQEGVARLRRRGRTIRRDLPSRRAMEAGCPHPAGSCSAPTGPRSESAAPLKQRPPSIVAHRRRVPPVGAWLALATYAGAALGYPLFLWLDPFAIFNSGLNAWRLPLTATSLLAGLGLPALLVFEFALPQLWCRRLCPLGATQDLLRRMRRGWARPTRRGEAVPVAAWAPDRRLFLAACAGAAGAMAAQTVGRTPPPLRPPGSVDEEEFPGVCVRCGNCAQVCPSRIIQPDLAGGLAGLLAPRINFSADFCRADCHRCHQVCPSGAIARLNLPEKRRAIIGCARVDFDTCLMAQGRECNACIQACPYEAVTVASGPDGFSSRPQVNLTQCNGCGACEVACPVAPLRSIRVHPTGKRSTLPA